VGRDVRFFGESDDEGEIVGVGAEMEVTIEEMLGNVSQEDVCRCERKKIEVGKIRGDVEDEFVGQGGERHCCGGRLDMIVYIFDENDRREQLQGSNPAVLSQTFHLFHSPCSSYSVPSLHILCRSLPHASFLSLPIPVSFFFSFPALDQPPLAPYAARTHDCGSLCATDVGSRAVLAGWLLPER